MIKATPFLNKMIQVWEKYQHQLAPGVSFLSPLSNQNWFVPGQIGCEGKMYSQ